MMMLGPRDMAMIFEITDGLGLHREGLRVPLEPSGDGSVSIEDGKLVIVLPAEADREAWIGALAPQIQALDGFTGLMRA